MPLQLTAAYSSRVKRKSQSSSLFGSRSPFASNPRRKPSSSQYSTSKAQQRSGGQAAYKDRDGTAAAPSPDFDEQLDDTGIIAALGADLNLRDVPQFIQYIHTHMFSPVPERAPGMSSTRIAEVLNYRISLPPIVTVAHVQALGDSPTRIEREIAELARAGIIRKISVPNRGKGSSAAGDGLVLVSEWERIVRAHPGLEDALKDKYIATLRANPTSTSIRSTYFLPAEIAALTTAGFLTGSNTPHLLAAAPAIPTLVNGTGGINVSLSSVGSRAPSGSVDAVGGSNAFSASGATGSGISKRSGAAAGANYNFALPNTGPYLRLLTAARDHLLSLLSKTKYKEAPMGLLRERWDGGVLGEDAASQAKKARGEVGTTVLPGRTKKWRQFYGITFEWVLEECVGAGLVECFETGSVGVGIRLAR